MKVQQLEPLIIQNKNHQRTSMELKKNNLQTLYWESGELCVHFFFSAIYFFSFMLYQYKQSQLMHICTYFISCLK